MGSDLHHILLQEPPRCLATPCGASQCAGVPRESSSVVGPCPSWIVTLRGSARGSILENLPQQGEIMPSISKIFPLCVPKAQNPPKIFLQTLPKPSQNLRKASQNPSRSPPGAHFGQMLERSSILNVQKAAASGQKHPKEAQDDPKPLPN